MIITTNHNKSIFLEKLYVDINYTEQYKEKNKMINEIKKHATLSLNKEFQISPILFIMPDDDFFKNKEGNAVFHAIIFIGDFVITNIKNRKDSTTGTIKICWIQDNYEFPMDKKNENKIKNLKFENIDWNYYVKKQTYLLPVFAIILLLNKIKLFKSFINKIRNIITQID